MTQPVAIVGWEGPNKVNDVYEYWKRFGKGALFMKIDPDSHKMSGGVVGRRIIF